MRPEGRRHCSVRDSQGDEVYRLSRPQGGKPWLWVDRYGERGGDLIDLVRELEPGATYAEAVWRLAGSPAIHPRPSPPALPPRTPPRLPRQRAADREAGRAYLAGRCLGQAAIERAEQAGMLGYTGGAVLFIGRDQQGAPQSVTRRATDQDDPVQRRDLAGTDKSFAPVLPGRADRVIVVEGGADALAAQDAALRRGREPSTVIVSGGSGVQSWIERCRVILARAAKIIIAGEHEKDAATQIKADAGHVRQAELIAAVAPEAEIEHWRPPEGDKDLADMHAREVREAEQRAAAVAQVEDPDEPEDDTPTPGGPQ